MFKDLFDLQKKRVNGEVFGFYVFYTFIGLILVGLLSGMIVGLFFGKTSFQEGYRMGRILGPIIGSLYAFILSIYIIINKNVLKNFKAILLLAFSVALTYLFGCIIGFIPLSFLTKIETNKPDEFPQ